MKILLRLILLNKKALKMMPERRLHMINNEVISTPQSRERIASWDRQTKALDEWFLASGRTVVVTAGSAGGELTATIPQGKRLSKAAPESWPTTDEVDAAIKLVDAYHHGPEADPA